MSNEQSHESLLRALAAEYAGMPPVAALQPAIEAWDGATLRLRAPLAPNVNDKGCAFGGSLASLMTLASWGLVFLQLRRAGLHAEVYVADNHVRYLRPVYQDIVVESAFEDAAAVAALAESLRARGRASLRLRAQAVLDDGEVAASFGGRFVAIATG